MNDFLTRINEDDRPEQHEVTIGGETGTVWFRRVSAGERAELLKGQKVTHVPGTGGTVEIDLFENQTQQCMLVQFSVCDENGKRVFRNLDAVRKLTDYKVKALYEVAAKVNKEYDDDLGKS